MKKVRDEYRDDYDPGRGGYGLKKSQTMTERSKETRINRKNFHRNQNFEEIKRIRENNQKTQKNPRFREEKELDDLND
ncbi:nuclear cap-binding protein subunit 2 [Anaeramoeba ignava]|uniref:Nuclear cap-binding protein subunit 2 n=1 Tax=Anaeramoeba ignava TaxID=1746090 RepID=A0A9Q0LLU2_ANAIG|nr:nuclear cap-binding protein subunit 2 [Anaeramoeba ignava]